MQAGANSRNKASVLLIEMLKFEGFDVSEAENGKVGFELAQQQHPDLILCDIMMPTMNGYEVLERVRQAEETRDAAFIFMTAKVSLQDIRYGMNLGAEDYLAKPVSREDLLQSISIQLNKRKLRKDDLAVAGNANEIAYSLLPHELLTPLNGILGMSSLLEATDSSIKTEDLQGIGRVIRQCGDKLDGTIQRFLVFFELQQNPQAPMFLLEPIDVRTVLFECVEKLGRRWQRRNDITVNVHHITLRANKRLLAYAMEQILDNALKFSGTGTPVKVNVNDGAHDLSFSVSDLGPGFSSTAKLLLEEILSPGYKLRQHGFGLGLQTTAIILKAIGGKMTVNTDNAGTTISCTLPHNAH